MSLKITLKPHEQMIVGGAVVSNSADKKIDLTIENNVPILRQKDIISENSTDTPCRRIYFVIQLMYIDEQNLTKHHNTYWRLVQDLIKAVPSMLGIIDQISEQITSGNYYQALKLAKKMIAYEQEVLKSV